jgi:hypothetical protein
MTIQVANKCNREVKIGLCVELLSGEMKCWNSPTFVKIGESWSSHECSVTGRYDVKAISTRPTPSRRPPRADRPYIGCGTWSQDHHPCEGAD